MASLKHNTLWISAALALGCGQTEAPKEVTPAPTAALSAPAPITTSVTAAVSVSVPVPVPVPVPASAAVPAEVLPCPPDMVKVGRACVDLYEGHLVTISSDGVETLFPHFQRLEKDTRYEARSSVGVFPQGYISRVESAAACKNSGKRLCSRAEWLRACEGPKHFVYPYGEKAKSGQCNNGKLHLLPQLFSSNARAWKYDETFNSPLLNQQPGYLAKSGEYTSCASDAGVLDMVGNLHEWVSDMVDEETEEKLETENIERRKQPWQVGNGIFMGGFFSTTSELGAGCYYTTIAHEPAYHDYSTGFRCCKDAAKEPVKPRPATRKSN